MVFLQTLVYNYLQLRHPDELAGTPRQPGASADDMGQDSYHKFYARRAAAPPARPRRQQACLPAARAAAAA